MILTDNGTTVVAYLNGNQEFSINDAQMNLNQADNPGQLINLFLDNTAGGGIGEFSDGRIALFEAFNGVLSSTDASTLAANPFANTGNAMTTPEPASWFLLLGSTALLFCIRRNAAMNRISRPNQVWASK